MLFTTIPGQFCFALRIFITFPCTRSRYFLVRYMGILYLSLHLLYSSCMIHIKCIILITVIHSCHRATILCITLLGAVRRPRDAYAGVLGGLASQVDARSRPLRDPIKRIDAASVYDGRSLHVRFAFVQHARSIAC